MLLVVVIITVYALKYVQYWMYGIFTLYLHCDFDHTRQYIIYINESQLQEGYSLRLNTVGVVLEPPSVVVVVVVVVVAVTLLY